MTERPTTKRQRQAIYAERKLKPRSKKATAEYLAMLQRQGEEMVERGHRLAAAIAVDDERQKTDGRYVAGAISAPVPGGTLAQKVSARTDAFYREQARTEAHYRDMFAHYEPEFEPEPEPVMPPRWWERWFK